MTLSYRAYRVPLHPAKTRALRGGRPPHPRSRTIAGVEEASAREQAPRQGIRSRLRPADAWFVVIIAAIIVLDQFTKWLVVEFVGPGASYPEGGLLRIVHVTNSGAAFGLFQDMAPLLAVTSLIGMAAILLYLFNPGFAHPVTRLGLACMFGGAVGNLIDRIRHGEVVDFVKLPNWPAFNVADSAITVGVCLLIAGMLFFQPGEQPERTSS